MSYTDPTILQNNPMAASVAKSVAASNAAMQATAGDDTTSKNIGSLIQGGVNLISQKRENLNKLNKAVLREDQKIYEKVGGFVTDFENFDSKSEAFFGELIDKYNNIKTHLNNGTMRDVSLGKKDLATIRNLVNQYGQAIPKVLAIADEIDLAAKKAGENGMGSAGTLSVAGAPAEQLAIIKKISSGGPSSEEIDIKYEGGTIILYDNKTGAELNIREFNRAVTSKENPYLKLVPDLSKAMTTAYDAFNKDNQDRMQNTFTSPAPDQDPNDPDALRIMSEDQEIQLRNALMGKRMTNPATQKLTNYRDGGSFKEAYRQHAESIWEDMMPAEMKGENLQWPENPPTFGDPEFGEFYETYKKPLLEYLATITIQDNATDIQRETQNEDEYNKRYGTGKFKGDKEEYDAKLEKFFRDADMNEDDRKALKEAKPGDEIVVTIYGKEQTIRKT